MPRPCLKSALLTVLLMGALLAPALALAQTNAPNCGGLNNINGICVPTQPAGAPDYQSLGQLVNDILKLALLVIGMITVLFVVIGGYKYLTAGGDEEKVKSAKGMITHAILGMVIVIFAYALVIIVANIVR